MSIVGSEGSGPVAQRIGGIARVVATGVVAAMVGGCVPTGGGADGPSPTIKASPAPSAAYPGRSHAPMDAVAVFEEEVQGTAPSGDEADHLIALALADPRVQARLAGARHAVLYVTTPPAASDASKEIDPQTLPEVVIYDYSADRWLVVQVDAKSGAVGPFKERDPMVDGQPPISPHEADEAVVLALTDPAGLGLSARAFKPVDRAVRQGRLGGVKCDTARCVLVILYSDSTRLSAFLQVDLGTRRVVGVFEE